MKRFVRRNIKYILTTLLLLVFFCCAVRGIRIRSVKDVRNEAQELAGISTTVSPGQQKDGQADSDAVNSDSSLGEDEDMPAGRNELADHTDGRKVDGSQAAGRQNSSRNDQEASDGEQSFTGQDGKTSEKSDSTGKSGKTSGKSDSTGKNKKTVSKKSGSAGKSGKTSGKSKSAGNNGNTSAKRKISDGTAAKPDQYHTDPVPSGRPEPVNEEDQSVNQKKSFYVYLSIDVLTILDHREDLKTGLEKYIPEDGWVLSKTQVLCYEGETAWDVMSRECKARGINVQSTYTPMYHSVYMEGINQIGEFDCGKNSGWIYEVDGWIPNYSSSRYVMVEGEYLRWRYSCVGFGADLDGVKR